MEHINGSDFYMPNNSIIFCALTTLYTQNSPIDQLTVCEQLQRDGQLDQVGGEIAISGIIGETASSANIIYHCQVVKDKYLKRQIILCCKVTLGEAFDDKNSGDELLAKININTTLLDEEVIKKEDYVSVESIAYDIYNGMNEVNNRENRILGIDTGMPSLNNLIGGFQGGHMIVLAGKPGEGKSACALEFAMTSACNDAPVGIFSLEMPEPRKRRRGLFIFTPRCWDR